ncbi:hypothetical protein JCGZ_01164 [Jatropha curcas]|uniref:Aminotransferase-like plant mobile domain-containing protein n=1 Tax=Jatropha curcas TaxID=180498 RepID=A0A067JU57_JATCU|nr:hypothetical protein JCGZ_01164 [Jatropha curcas]
MSQLPEIAAFAYTPEVNTLGAIPDIMTFEGERVPVSRNALTPRTRPLQLLPLLGTDFPVRYETSAMRGFQTEVDLGKARAGGSSTDASAFWDLLDPPMRARVVAAGFGDYVAGLHRTQPRFLPAMRYALMEQWNDCTHTFIFDFGEMTLTPVDYTAITGLGFDGLFAPLDAQYQTAALGAQLVWAYEYRIYLGGPGGDTSVDSRRIPRYLAHCHHTFSSTEDPHYWRCFLNDRALSDLLLTPWEGDAWQAYPARGVVEAYTQSRFLLQGYWLDWYFLGERIYELQVATAQRRVPHAPPRHMCLLEGMTAEDREEEYFGSPADIPLSAGDYATYFSTRLQTRLPEVPAQRYQELCRRFGFARSYIARLYSERHERDLEIGRLRRHQSRQSSAVARLQMEVDQLRTRLEVEGIPLDFSEDEEDDDGSSSDDAPPSPPPQAAAGPSRRRR